MVVITKKNIRDLIVHPEKITDEQLPLLINLTKEYPFSSLLNTLLAKVYNLSNDVAYHNQLEKVNKEYWKVVIISKDIEKKIKFDVKLDQVNSANLSLNSDLDFFLF